MRSSKSHGFLYFAFVTPHLTWACALLTNGKGQRWRFCRISILIFPAQHIDMTAKVEEQMRSSPNGSRLMQMLETYPRMIFVDGVPRWVTNFQICDALSKSGSVSFCWAINGEDNSSILLLYREVSVHTG